MFDYNVRDCTLVSDAIITRVNHHTVHYRVTALSLQLAEACPGVIFIAVLQTYCLQITTAPLQIPERVMFIFSHSFWRDVQYFSAALLKRY